MELRPVREPLGYLVKTAWRFSRGERRRLIVYVLLSTAAIVVSLFEPYAIAQVVNAAQRGAKDPSAGATVFNWLLALAGLEFLFWCLHGPSRVMEREVGYRIRCQYQLALFRAVTLLPLHWQREHHSGETIDRIQRATTSLGDQISDSFLVIHLLTRFLGSLLMLCVFLPEAGILVSGITALVCAINIFFDRRIFIQDQALNKMYHRIASGVHDYLTNVTTLISLRLGTRAESEVFERMRIVERPFGWHVRVVEFKWFLTTMLVQALVIGTMGLFIYRTMNGNSAVLAGTLVMLFEYLRRVGDSFFQFAWKYGDLMTAASKIRSAESILLDRDALGPSSKKTSLPAGWRELQIRNLRFSYTDAEGSRNHVDGLTFVLQRGKSVAFVGESGSGKSTTLALLRGLEVAQNGEVWCDGEKVDAGLSALSSQVTLIPQAPEIFAETVRFNITIGRKASDEELLADIERARFSDVLSRLPQGLDTNVAEKGISLSGGERQRLALTRGLFYARDSEIVLLDEPTSSVDPLNERLIYERLLAENRDKVIVSALHRPHLLPLFDYIYVFEDGEIVEQGTYSVLAKGGTKFSRIVQATTERVAA